MKLTLLENERRTNVSCKRSSKCGSNQEPHLSSQIKWNDDKFSPDYNKSKFNNARRSPNHQESTNKNTELCLFGQKVSRMESYPSKDSLNANCEEAIKTESPITNKKREVISKTNHLAHNSQKKKNESLKELLKDYPKVYEDMANTTESADFNTEHLNSKGYGHNDSYSKLNTKGVTHVGINEHNSKDVAYLNRHRHTPCNRTNTAESMFSNFRGRVEVIPHVSGKLTDHLQNIKDKDGQLNIQIKAQSQVYSSNARSIRKKRNNNKKYRRTTAIVSKTTNLLTSDESK